MSIIVIRKDYSKIPGRIEQAKEALTDIGWFYSQVLYHKPQPEEKRRFALMDNAESAREYFIRLLSESSQEGWLREMNLRASSYVHTAFASGLQALTVPHSNSNDTEQCKRFLDLCLELYATCVEVQRDLNKEAEQKAQEHARLLD